MRGWEMLVKLLVMSKFWGSKAQDSDYSNCHTHFKDAERVDFKCSH